MPNTGINTNLSLFLYLTLPSLLGGNILNWSLFCCRLYLFAHFLLLLASPLYEVGASYMERAGKASAANEEREREGESWRWVDHHQTLVFRRKKSEGQESLSATEEGPTQAESTKRRRCV